MKAHNARAKRGTRGSLSCGVVGRTAGNRVPIEITSQAVLTLYLGSSSVGHLPTRPQVQRLLAGLRWNPARKEGVTRFLGLDSRRPTNSLKEIAQQVFGSATEADVARVRLQLSRDLARLRQALKNVWYPKRTRG
ncbi:MAG TPA: hypothetical protein HA252_04075 [Candidatus Diapherotrites archaeon]|uniref:Uncharacterized protein n=1 Tax=Candidatus Iainarchaeum sp. TaxID=3101447 RepID=A0A7J4JGU9_9ARCH|nr:hypothetical protein [Candidatus Diapherotrites archaeon]HIH16554.1 hypothetical protein [Candidatus Diapherotrites archaeon]